MGMRIGIDGNEANVSERVGVNTFAYEVLWGLYRLQGEGGDHEYVIYLSSAARDDLPKARRGWEYRVLPGGGYWIIRKLVPELLFTKLSLDVFFSPSHYCPLISRVPQVCAIMDLGYLESSGHFRAKDYWQLRLWSASSMMVSKYIISISNATKVDIVKHYPRVKDKVRVVHLAYDANRFNEHCGIEERKEIERIKRRYAIGSEDYMLFLGTLKPSKNVEGLVTAWKEVCEKHPKVRLVIAGKKGWLFDNIFEKVKELGIVDRVVFTGFVKEEDKPFLIKGAKVFVIPSYWEGFGLDVLSAMASGVVVISSDRGSLPEVMGKAGLMIDPEKPEKIALTIDKVLSWSSNEYNKKVEEGIAQAKKFSWDKTARETLLILEKAGNG